MKKNIVLSVENLHVQLGKRMINKNISINVKEGEIVGIIGPNGCGKTTFFNAISGFAPIDTGLISINGEEVNNFTPHQRARKGLSRGFQNVGVFKEMTLEENIIMAIEQAEQLPWYWMFSRQEKKRVEKRVDTILDDVDLLSHKQSLAGLLSGGQLRLLEMAKLHALGGSLVLIDEPTAGVSPVLRGELRNAIAQLAKKHGRTILIIEHDLKFLFDLVDRVVVLVDGKKYMEGKPKEVQNDARLREVYFGT
ncbi:MAG: hypothetical protein CL685_02020 [Candidatus Magasanikbacteria bacterium]|nr:hypothetical protein [Candidatus Magasanikbacteria bacterium]|tara:strand:+ start:1348 stop:2100 length:753 start_codon:yes stop_codon:yes gene_type:complete